MSLFDRITVNPKQCGGHPCIRSMRIRVSDVLGLFASGLSAEKILDELPDLEPDDVKVCLLYARRRIDLSKANESFDFWPLLHPDVRAHSKSRFDSGHFADAVEAVLKHINSKIKNLVFIVCGLFGFINRKSLKACCICRLRKPRNQSRSCHNVADNSVPE